MEKVFQLRAALLALAGRISTTALQDQSELMRIRSDDRAVFESVAKASIQRVLKESAK